MIIAKYGIIRAFKGTKIPAEIVRNNTFLPQKVCLAIANAHIDENSMFKKVALVLITKELIISLPNPAASMASV